MLPGMGTDFHRRHSNAFPAAYRDEADEANIFIDGMPFAVTSGSSIIDAAAEAHVYVPRLCHHPILKDHPAGTCGICAVEIEGEPGLSLACATEIQDGMHIRTRTAAVRKARADAMAEMRANQRVRDDQETAMRFGTEFDRLAAVVQSQDHVDSNHAIQIDTDKCVGCSRCARMCGDVLHMEVLKMGDEDDRNIVKLMVDGISLAESSCIGCGQCSVLCPVDAITEAPETAAVFAALRNPRKTTCVQIAPSIRVAIGEEFGLDLGTITTGKLVTALRRLGFQYVFDTQYSADLTIMEEGTELIDRLDKNVFNPVGIDAPKLPMFTSCCPAWVNYVEKRRPDLIDNLSTCKSPMSMLSALIKEYFIEQIDISVDNIYCAAVMPCTAKKQEITRAELSRGCLTIQHTDAVITTRELAQMIREAHIDFANLEEGEFDDIFGTSSGAGAIFGSTGGVTEAAVRTIFEYLTRDELRKITFTECRGLEGLREATIPIPVHDHPDFQLKVAICSSIGVAHKLLKGQTAEDLPYHFIEVMSCPGGCINGGGQPRSVTDPRYFRQCATYEIDTKMEIRRSFENPMIIDIYDQLLGEPNSETAHHLLHTTYTDRSAILDHQTQKENALEEEMNRIEIVARDSILILYGSKTGTSQGFAQRVDDMLKEQGLFTRLMSMDDPAAMELIPQYSRIIFHLSTWGRGVAAPSAAGLVQQISELPDNAWDGKFAFTGLWVGSSAFRKNFVKAGRDLEAQLERLGANVLVECGVADQKAEEGSFETGFITWSESLIPALGVTQKSPVQADPKGILIVYGSKTGTAEGYANRINDALTERGLSTRLISADLEGAIEVIPEYNRVIWVISTWGRGQMPPSARDLYQEMCDLSDGSWNGAFQFTGLWIGSSAFRKNFVKAGRDLEAQFTRLGCSQLVECGVADQKADGSFESGYETWLPTLFPALDEE